MEYIAISITVPNKKFADTITKHLIENKLVSCVNIIPKIQSVYWWENKICKKSEYLLICKSIKNKFKKITAEVKKLHPYKVPEIVCFDIQNGNLDYLTWIKENTKQRIF